MIINGIFYELEAEFTVQTLLDYLSFDTSVIVLDYNGSILQKEVWKNTKLEYNDKVEILTVVGGG